MAIHTTAHLNFRGEARAALEFYRSVFGGELTTVTYGDVGAPVGPDEARQVMWGQVLSPDGFRVMAYDVPPGTAHEPGVIPFFVSVRGADPAEIRRYWDALADGAVVVAPLAASGWAPLYGMLRDRFGITWVLDVEAARDGA
jgi:PhnB protein